MNLFREVHEDFTCQRVAVLLMIAEQAGETGYAEQLTVKEILKLSTSGMSNHVKSLAEFGRGLQAGLRWIEVSQAPHKRTHNLLRLSPEGRKIVQKVQKIMAEVE